MNAALLDKIRKLRALANSPNLHEAASAARLAENSFKSIISPKPSYGFRTVQHVSLQP